MEFALVPLRQLLKSGVSSDTIQNIFDKFVCARNHDVEFFLQNYAIANECLGASRNYLLVDKQELVKGHLVLVAFFTIAVTETDYSQVDEGKRLEIMGRYPKVKTEKHFPGYLLAQLARDDRYTNDTFDCKNLLGVAEEIINQAASSVGGNVIYLDCIEDLIGYYRDLGYEVLPDAGNNNFFKMFKRLPKLCVD